MKKSTVNLLTQDDHDHTSGGRNDAGGFDFHNIENEETIPETNSHRCLILCFDGTGNQFDDDNSNVVNFVSLLKKDKPDKQLVYYQAGIGSYDMKHGANPLRAKAAKVIDSMIAVNLDHHVISGYEFLSDNYQEGDKIFLFGFSRGAYIARALAGMLHKVGLLPRGNRQQIPFAFTMYSREDEVGWRQSTAFKRSFSIDVSVEMVGVWDTVASVGIIPKRLPFTLSNTHIRYFRHALALDEHRVRFQPSLYIRPKNADVPEQPKRPQGNEVQGNGSQGDGSRMSMASTDTRVGSSPKGKGSQDGDEDRASNGNKGRNGDKNKDGKPKNKMRALERKYGDRGKYITDVQEVWFSGCHSDVGGGAVANNERYSLARIPLRWMIRQCFLLDTGILFYRDLLPRVGIDAATLYPVVRQRPPPVTADRFSTHTRADTDVTMVDETDKFVSEEHEDLRDACARTNDELKRLPAWWLLECIPAKARFQNAKDEWIRKYQFHMGGGRVIPKRKGECVRVHRTVKTRMAAQGLAEGVYKAKAVWKTDPVWVDGCERE
ncbi:hypothetical protein BD626DRAFT_478028 [Schizophyllum amplum]|uniref:T6SS Phospholipase effector Tle1-like catalytic domain-containing protein n=1 Tax=Schizophyllum amplum TaxID=97359 RepID=A0A550D0P8_9AGAR|nr:hypothetical protein BD626DRAFT_478028 [Auriculariopsis ampla]